MSGARRINRPGLIQTQCSDFNPLIPPHHKCYDDMFKEKTETNEQNKELVCTWSRESKDNTQFDGDFDMKKYRPKCEDMMKPPEKTRPNWCYTNFKNLIPRCQNPCPTSHFACKEPEEEYPEKQPWRRVPCNCPQFLWSHGYATLNIFNARYPEQAEGLKFRERKEFEKVEKEEGIRRSNPETELWSLTCMPSDTRPPLWKTMGVRTPWCCRPVAPLYLWTDGRPRPNDLRLPYPGHGFKLFDSCQHRRPFPPQCLARNVNGVFAPPVAICGKPYCF